MESSDDFDFDKRSKAIYSVYLRTVQVLLVDYEILTGEFLIQALNETRAAFTHLARANIYASANVTIAEDNCVKAERHIKRAILDCYKGLCLAYFNKMKEFKAEYSSVDLSLADNGKFLPELERRQNKASVTYKKARKADIDGTEFSEEEVFSLYEDAYLAHKDLEDYRASSSEKLVFAKAATDANRQLTAENNKLVKEIVEESKRSGKLSKVSIGLGVFGAVAAVVSIVEAVIIACL